jgi:6-phosphofructokinase
LVSIELKNRKKDGRYKGSFSAVCHYFGYQGRCALPSIYDCELGNCYGYLAGILVEGRCTGYCTTARGISIRNIFLLYFLTKKKFNQKIKRYK